MKAQEKAYLDAVEAHLTESAEGCKPMEDSVMVIDHSITVVKGIASEITMTRDNRFMFRIKPIAADINKIDDHEYKVSSNIMRTAIVSASCGHQRIEFTIQNNEIIQIKI